jgi:hypothetical protein
MKLTTMIASTGIGLVFALTGIAYAQAPAGSTGECKDGTYTTNATKRGACSGHKGVKEWYGAKGASAEEKAPKAARMTKAEKAAANKAAEPSASPRPAPAAGAASTMGAAPATTMPSSKATNTAAMRTTAAAGGGAGKVWVNSSSNVYHCMNDQWYGKTKQGEYMSEAEAKAKGAHAARGKSCG